jgi:hypothetical protein
LTGLLASHGHDRVDARGPSRGDIGRNQRNQREESRDQTERRRIGRFDAE